MAKVIDEGRTAEGWHYKVLDDGTTAWSDGLGGYEASGPDGHKIPESDAMRARDGRVIRVTRNGVVTQEAFEEIEGQWLELDRDVTSLNAKLDAVWDEFDQGKKRLDARMGGWK